MIYVRSLILVVVLEFGIRFYINVCFIFICVLLIEYGIGLSCKSESGMSGISEIDAVLHFL